MATSTLRRQSAGYFFLDEGGNLDFSAKGSRYFTMSCVRCFRPFPIEAELSSLKFDLIEAGTDIEYFHASEDRQVNRDRMFGLMQTALPHFRVDSIVVEKSKTGPALRSDQRFYPEMLGYLMRYAIKKTNLQFLSDVVVITDRIPVNKKRGAVEGAVKSALKKMLPASLPFRVLHHDSKSCNGLQIADYFNWAIFRKWERGDDRSLKLVSSAVASQFDIFQTGTRHYY